MLTSKVEGSLTEAMITDGALLRSSTRFYVL
jgi:hypothetical protein